MDIVAYQSFTSPGTQHVLLENIKNFASARGWTIDEWRTSCAWSSGWISGNDSFLQLHTHGYGSQYAGFRFRAYNYYIVGNYGSWFGGANNRHIRGKMFKSAEATYANVAAHPVDQGTGSYVGSYDQDVFNNSVFAASTDGFLKQVCFGNDKFIDSIIQIDSTFFCRIMFGIPELWDTSLADAVFKEHYYTIAYNDAACTSMLDNYATNTAKTVAQFYFNGGQQYNSGPLFLFSAHEHWAAGPNYESALQPNTFALARPVLRDAIFAQISSVRHGIGYMPYGRINGSGLQPFQELDYGTETYMAYPLAGGATTKIWGAYRIA